MKNVHKQSGVALIIGLIVLLLLSLIGITAMRSSTLEERMAGNVQNRNVAFQAAEAALRAGEARLRTAPKPILCADTAFVYCTANPAAQTAPRWKRVSWTAGSTGGSAGYSGLDNINSNYQARYIVEKLPGIPPGSSLGVGGRKANHAVYRVTARAVGPGGRAVVELQSTYDPYL